MSVKNIIILSFMAGLSYQFINGQYKEFVYNDSIRQYAVYEPELDPNPNGYPLIIGLHGSSSEGYVFIASASLVSKQIEKSLL